MTSPLSRTGRERRALVVAACAAPALAAPRLALAGAQVEEPLADAVRSALAAAIADRAPPKPTLVMSVDGTVIFKPVLTDELVRMISLVMQKTRSAEA